MQKILDRGIEFLKGVGPQKADALKLDLGIYTFKDLLLHFPFRHIDKTKFHDIRSIATDGETVQIRGILRNLEMKGEGRAKRLVGTLRDSSGSIDLVWFQSAQWIQRSLAVNREYIAYGRVTEFGRRFNMTHPDMELVTSETGERARTFDPVYPSTEKLKKKNLDAAGIRRLMRTLFDLLSESDIPENLPDYLIEHFKIENRYSALQKIHFPENQDDIDTATRRLKFEELFLLQLRLLQCLSKPTALNWF